MPNARPPTSIQPGSAIRRIGSHNSMNSLTDTEQSQSSSPKPANKDRELSSSRHSKSSAGRPRSSRASKSPARPLSTRTSKSPARPLSSRTSKSPSRPLSSRSSRSPSRPLSPQSIDALGSQSSHGRPRRKADFDPLASQSTHSHSRQRSSHQSAPNQQWVDERILRQDDIVRMASKKCQASSKSKKEEKREGEELVLGDLSPTSGGYQNTTRAPVSSIDFLSPWKKKSSKDDENDWYDSSKLEERQKKQPSLLDRVSAYVETSSTTGSLTDGASSLPSTNSLLSATKLGIVRLEIPSKHNSRWDL